MDQTKTPENRNPSLPADFDINRPQRGAREGYFYLWVEMNKEYGQIVNSMTPGRYDPRLVRKVRQMIATIVDDNLQLLAWNLFDSTITSIKKDETIKTADERNELIMDTCDVMLGLIWSYYDQYMGVSHRLKAGHASPPPSTADEDIEVKRVSDTSTTPTTPAEISDVAGV